MALDSRECLSEAYNKTRSCTEKSHRAIAGAKYNDASSPLFRHLKIMKFKNLRDMYMYIQHFVYEFVNDILPEALSHIFEYNRDIPRHNTRHGNDPRPPKANSDIMRKSLIQGSNFLDGSKYRHQELENQTYFQETSYATLSTKIQLNHREWCHLFHQISTSIVSVCICGAIIIHIIYFSIFWSNFSRLLVTITSTEGQTYVLCGHQECVYLCVY